MSFSGQSTSSSYLSASSAIRPNQRMRRLASHLANIRISLDPPSPPSLSPSPLPDIPDRGMNLLTVPAFMDHFTELEAPRRLSEGEAIRISSPPPDRRTSFASTYSDASSMTLPMSNSYQNLLSPMWTTVKYISDDNETPPNEPALLRPRSAQVWLFLFHYLATIGY